MANKYVFWQQAIDEGTDYWKRNQQIAENIFNQWSKLDQQSFSKETWVSGKLWDYGVWEQEWANTMSDVKNRYNKLKTPDQTEIKLDSQTEMETWATTPDTLRQKNLKVRDEEYQRIEDEKNIALDEKIDSWNLSKSEYEKNKNYYKNFDVESQKYDQIIDSIRNQIKNTWQDLTEDQYQAIANKLWVDVNDVKDPWNLLKNQLELTEEWKKKFWFDKLEWWIDGLERDYERGKEDLKYRLDWQVTNLENQLEDVKIQLERNIGWLESQGAWSWWLKSSWFMQGINNVKADWQRTIDRLNDMLDRVKEADTTNLSRLSEDFERATAEAQEHLSTQMWELNLNLWTQLNWLAEEYGIGSEWLATQLDKISKEYWLQAVDTLNSYYDNMKKVDLMINSNIDRQEKLNTLQDEKANKRYNQLLANDWLLLQNTSMNEIVNEVNKTINYIIELHKYKGS